MRPFLLAFVLGLALDAGGAAAITYFAPKEDRWVTFFVSFLAIVLLPIVPALWVFAKTWLVAYLFERERLARYYLAEMNRLDMPETSTFFAADDYLGAVAMDKQASDHARVKAAIWLGELLSLNHSKPLSSSIIHRMALVDAMQSYRKKFRPTHVSFDEDEFVRTVENDIWTVR